MGRPIKKSWFSDVASAGSQLRFIAKVDGAAAQNCWVRSQRGTRKYKLVDESTDLIVKDCYLVNKASADLALGEASMVVTPFVGNIGYASKITQHRVSTFASTTKGGILTVTVTGGGTGYTAGDVLTVAGGAGTGAFITVLTAPGGVIATVSVTTEGTNYLVADALTVTGPGNDDATFSVATVYAAAATYTWSGSAANAVGEADLVTA